MQTLPSVRSTERDALSLFSPCSLIIPCTNRQIHERYSRSSRLPLGGARKSGVFCACLACFSLLSHFFPVSLLPLGTLVPPVPLNSLHELLTIKLIKCPNDRNFPAKGRLFVVQAAESGARLPHTSSHLSSRVSHLSSSLRHQAWKRMVSQN